MTKILTNKHAVISGGGTGIGRAIAVRFAEQGATVTVVGRTEASLNETASLIGSACDIIVCDVADRAAWEAMIDACPRLDVLVNNAALSYSLNALTEDLDKWQSMLSVNLYGTLNGCRAAGRHMARNNGGRIINITSIHGTLAEVGSAHYGIAKAAINQLTRCLATEWAPHNILVNAVAPGAVDTPMSRASGENELETDWFKEIYVARRRIPLARAGRPEEIAEAAMFLANPKNTYMTGHILTVDGGLSVTF